MRSTLLPFHILAGALSLVAGSGRDVESWASSSISPTVKRESL